MNWKKFSGDAVAAQLIFVAIMTLAPRGIAQVKFQTIHAFSTRRTDGKLPIAGLVFDAAGNLYGTTYSGGAYGNGAVFGMTPEADGSWGESVLLSFKIGPDGDYPWASLTVDQAGNLYGTTGGGGNSNCYFDYGCGVVFKLSPNKDGTWAESELYTFTGGNDGEYPRSFLIFDPAGNLYSTTANGGTYGDGVVFRLTPNSDGTWTEEVLHAFSGGNDGNGPSGLIFDAAGNLYGATGAGGADGYGVVFKLKPNPDGSWTEEVLHQFTGGKDGSGPSGVIFDAAGNLYGTAGSGGSYGAGVAFKLMPNPNGSWEDEVLHEFTGGNDGGWPSGLAFDAAGNLYGTTWGGGNPSCLFGSGCGVVFRLTVDSNGAWHESVLHSFLDHPGGWPDAGVILDAAGNLYGTASNYFEGGCYGSCGTVFEITP